MPWIPPQEEHMHGWQKWKTSCLDSAGGQSTNNLPTSKNKEATRWALTLGKSFVTAVISWDTWLAVAHRNSSGLTNGNHTKVQAVTGRLT